MTACVNYGPYLGDPDGKISVGPPPPLPPDLQARWDRLLAEHHSEGNDS